jgi:hypothetical protein
VTGDRIGDAARHGRPGGEVDDGVGAIGDLGQCVDVEDRAVDEFDIDAVEIVGEARGQVVEGDDVIDIVERAELPAEVRPDEPSPAGHDHAHRVIVGSARRGSGAPCPFHARSHAPRCERGPIGAGDRARRR